MDKLPQLANGYLRVANEIWDALGMFKITKNQRAALWLILRMSYGCQQKACQFDEWRDFAKCADINEGQVKGVIQSLEAARVIGVDREHKVIAFNKNYGLWSLPVSDFDESRYTNLVKQNLKYRSAIADYAESLFDEFGKTESDSEKPNRKTQTQLGKTELAIRKNRIETSVNDDSVRSKVHLKDTLKDINKNKSARVREKKVQNSIIDVDDLLHAINKTSNTEIANKGSWRHEQMLTDLLKHSFDDEIEPVIKQVNNEGIEFSLQLAAIYERVVGEVYE